MVKKKIIGIIMAVILICTMTGPYISVKAQEKVSQGTLGPEMSWALDDEGVLNINGNGDMNNFDEENPAPWYSMCAEITKVIIGEDVNSIGDYAFFKCENLKTVTVLSENIKSVGKYAFAFCEKMKEVDFAGVVEKVEYKAFTSCENLNSFGKMTAMKMIEESAFENAQMTLEDFSMFKGVETIGDFAFCNGFLLPEKMEIPDSVKYVGRDAFTRSYYSSAIWPETIEKYGDWPTGQEKVIIETSKNIVVYDTYYEKEGEGKSPDIEFERIQTIGEVTVENKRSTSIYVDGIEVEPDKKVISNPVREDAASTPEEPDSDRISLVQYRKIKCWMLGRKFDPEGLVLKVKHKDGTTENVQSGYTASDIDTSTRGTKTVKITYGNATVSYGIEVRDYVPDYTFGSAWSGEAGLTINYFSAGSTIDLYFTPYDTGVYAFYLPAPDGDIEGTLMDLEGNIIKGETGGNVSNYFFEEYTLKAGTTYVLRTKLLYATGYSVGIRVRLQRLTGECNHAYKEYNGPKEVVEPTCFEEGYSIYECCKCGHQMMKDYTEKLEHDYSKAVFTVEPTCTDRGYTLYTCIHCESVWEKRDVTSKLGHAYVETVVEPTEKEYGYTLRECERCGSHYKTAWVDPTGVKIQNAENESVVQDILNDNQNEKKVTYTTTAQKKIKAPKVSAKRSGKKIKLKFSGAGKNGKYQIYVKKNGTYKKIKTTKKKTYCFKYAKKCTIKVRIVRTKEKNKTYGKFKKLKV